MRLPMTPRTAQSAVRAVLALHQPVTAEHVLDPHCASGVCEHRNGTGPCASAPGRVCAACWQAWAGTGLPPDGAPVPAAPDTVTAPCPTTRAILTALGDPE